MKVTVLGASGKTGAQVIAYALERGYDVVAPVRRFASVRARPRLEVIEGDILDDAFLTRTVAGSSAVLSALGSREGARPTTLYSGALTSTMAAMRRCRIDRVLVVSAIPVEPPEWQSFASRYIVVPILRRFFGGAYDDMRRMEAALVASDLAYTIFRPPRLIDGNPSRYRTSIDAPLPRAMSVSRSTLARAMVDGIDNPGLMRRVVTIAE